MSHYLDVQDLNFYYADFQALYGINVYFEKNTTTTLIGASGSGKTTLLRTFNRIYELQHRQRATGKILFEDQDILDNEVDVNLLRRKIGMVFQNFALMPHRSVLDNIAMPLEIRGISKNQRYEEVDKVLNIVELKGWGNKFINEFS